MTTTPKSGTTVPESGIPPQWMQPIQPHPDTLPVKVVPSEPWVGKRKAKPRKR